jgi:5-methylcytosine-specific restriction endonuclease McrA
MKHKSYRYGDYEYCLWDFRESEFIEDPESDIDSQLRSRGVDAADRQESYDDYLESSYWAKVRMKALVAANCKCSRCGSLEKLQVHHKQYCKRFTELQNMHLLEVLCQSCHQQEHS